MMSRMLVAGLVVFALSGLWVLAVRAGRRFALRHPDLGRYREEGGECGRTCGCASWRVCAKKTGVAPQPID